MNIVLTEDQNQLIEHCKSHHTDPTGAVKMCMHEFIEKSHPSSLDGLKICLARMEGFKELAKTGTSQQLVWRTSDLVVDLLKLLQEYNEAKDNHNNSGQLKGAQTIVGMCGFN